MCRLVVSRSLKTAVLATLGLALLIPIVLAVVAPLSIVAPASGNIYARFNLSVNVTFSGPANVSIDYNTTPGSYANLVSASYRNDSYNYTWQTASGPYADGRYDLRITAVNSSDATDNGTQYLLNVTVDNTKPTAASITVQPNATASGTLYANATPSFSAVVSDSGSGVVSCEFANDSSSGFVPATLGNGVCLYNYTSATALADGTALNVTFRATDAAGNVGDNASRLAVTVDDQGPLVENVSASSFAIYNGVYYVNASPIFTADRYDGGSGISACWFSYNSTFNFTPFYVTSSPKCSFATPPLPDSMVFNVSFEANDRVGNMGAPASRVTFVVDAIPPAIFFGWPTPGSIFRDGTAIPVDALVTDAGVNVSDGSPCFVTLGGISNASGNFSGAVTYSAATGHCTGTLAISALADGTWPLNLSVSDALGNANSSVVSVVMDSTPPNVTTVLFSTTHPQTNVTPVNITVTAADASGVSAVWITNGTVSIPLNLISGNAMSGQYNIYHNLTDLGCANEAVCPLTVTANDTIGNVNGTVFTGASPYLLYIDSYPPVVLANSTNATGSTAFVGDPVLFSATWSDVSLVDQSTALNTSFMFYDPVAQGWDRIFNNTGYLGYLNGNMTNFTYAVPRAFEGKTFIGVISLTDANGHTSPTANLTVTILNQSPFLVVLSPANDSAISPNDTISFTIDDFGSGINLSALTVNITGSANSTLLYTANATAFNCTEAYDYARSLDNANCTLNAAWPLSNATFVFTAADNAGNVNSTALALFITDANPEIVNLSINGVLVANTTSSSIATPAITNGSVDSSVFIFNWSVKTNYTIAGTTIALADLVPDNAVTTATLPAAIPFNVTAGKNYIVINTTLLYSTLHDSVLVNLTANIPLDLAALSASYAAGSGIVTAFNVSDASDGGVDITGQTAYVNRTVDIIITAANATGAVPFVALFDYSGWDGLALRWNATRNAFNVTSGSAADVGNASALVRANVTIMLKNAGTPAVFFDNHAAPAIVSINLSMANRTFYYSFQNASESAQSYPHLFLLQQCAGGVAPASIAAAQDACSLSAAGGNMTLLYLPRFDQLDRIFAAQAPSSVPALTLQPGGATTVSQSVIPLSISVITAFPNSTFCAYNLSRINDTNASISYPLSIATLPSSAFSIVNATWQYQTRFIGVIDAYNYTESVTCRDQYGLQNSTTVSFRVLDTTPPAVSNVSVSNIDYETATISASADELSNFSVYYGTDPRALSNYLASTDDPSLSDSLRLSGLFAGTQYYYNVSACDYKGQCNVIGNGTSPFTFTTPTRVQGLSRGGLYGGGGGSGGSSVLPDVVEASDARVWDHIAAGTIFTDDIQANMTFTKVSMRFLSDVNALMITVRQFKSKPANISGVPGTAYKYLQIEQTGADGNNTQDRFIDFAIDSSWLVQNGFVKGDIVLYRLEAGGWKAYPATMISQFGSTMAFTASVPGFSYFAVGADKAAAGLQGSQPQPSDATGGGAAQDGTAAGAQPENASASPQSEQPSGGFVSSRAQAMHIPAFVIVIVVALLTVAGGVVGVQQYRRYQVQQAQHEAKLREERVSLAREGSGTGPGDAGAHSEDGMIDELDAMLAEKRGRPAGPVSSGTASATASAGGINPADGIAGVAKAVVYSDEHDTISYPLHDPVMPMRDYIHRMRAKGFGDAQVRQRLLEAGWDDLVVDIELLKR